MCFNEAETKMSRKYWLREAGLTESEMLQWGRDKNVSEIYYFLPYLSRVTMLQWGRDKNVSEITRTSSESAKLNICFNEAETKMSRKSS